MSSREVFALESIGEVGVRGFLQESKEFPLWNCVSLFWP